jgi:hypothetical protein
MPAELDIEDPAPSERASKQRRARVPNEDQSVAKANEAIAIRPKRGKLTLLSRRIYNVLLFHAQQQGVDKPRYSILLSELIDDARFNSKNTELLKSHIRDMQSTTIEWHTSGVGRQKWTSTQLVGTVEIDEPGRGAPCTITWSFPEAIRDKLVLPTVYTRILLEVSSQMRSYAAAVLYELGARYLTSPGRLTMREDVVWWGSVLTGRSDITSVDYRILHRDTIKKALAELDALSQDFRMEVVEHKRGRKVEELQFRVIPKPQQSLGLQDSARNIFDLQLVERMVGLGMKRPDAQDLYAVTDEGALRAALEHVEQRMRHTTLPPIASAVAYFKDALKKQYAGTAPSAPAETTPAPTALPLSTEERLERLREEWKHAKSIEARSLYADMPEAQRDTLAERFEAERLSELPSPIARAWRKGGVESKVASSSFFRWMVGVVWPEGETERALLEFALSHQTWGQ